MQIEARKTGVEKFLLSSIWSSCECGLTCSLIAASADNLRPIAEEIFQGGDERECKDTRGDDEGNKNKNRKQDGKKKGLKRTQNKKRNSERLKQRQVQRNNVTLDFGLAFTVNE